MRRIAYAVYHRLKQTWLASLLVFHGQRFYQTSTGAIPSMVGVVTALPEGALDGDICWEQYVPDDQWEYHVEVTPLVQTPALVARCRTLRAGDVVELLRSTIWYDPPHGAPGTEPDADRTPDRGWMEARPEDIRILAKAA